MAETMQRTRAVHIGTNLQNSNEGSKKLHLVIYLRNKGWKSF